MGAFSRMVAGAKSIRFKNRLDKYEADRYRFIISRVFSRMDDYFTKSGLYACNDYEHVVDRILIDREYGFELSRNMPSQIRGRFQRYNPFVNGSVKINSRYLYDDIETESTLCHEVIHMISTGCDTITYSIPKGSVELVLPDNYSLKAGYKKTTRNGKSKTEVLEYSDVSHNGFFKEGLTELLRQRIYSIEESKDSYPLQTSFVRLINTIVGIEEDKVLREFLQGDLESYRKFFGMEYSGLRFVLDKFMEEYKSIDSFYKSEGLQKVYGIVITKAFKEFSKTNPSIEDLFKYIDLLSQNIYVFDNKTVYDSSIVYATRIFRETVSKDISHVERFREEYKRAIELKENSEWYKHPVHLKMGFRVSGLKEDIYFCPSRYSPMGVMAIMYGDTIMSNFLIPSKVGGRSKLGNCHMGDTPIEIYRPQDNTVVYTQGDTTRKVVVEDGKCLVYDANDKLIDGGYLATSGNDTLKAKQYNDAVDNIFSFVASLSTNDNESISTDDIPES